MSIPSSRYIDCKIYVVDDDGFVLDSVSALLTSVLHCDVKCFPNAQACFDNVAMNPPHCIVSDYNMPDMNGLELQSEITKMDQGVAFVFMSGVASIPVAVSAMEDGAVSFVEKPIGPEKLVDKVRLALDMTLENRKLRKEKEIAIRLFREISDDEWQVLQYLLVGKLNKQIAGILDIGKRTVERRKQQILTKTNSLSIVEVARLLQAAGIAVPKIGSPKPLLGETSS